MSIDRYNKFIKENAYKDYWNKYVPKGLKRRIPTFSSSGDITIEILRGEDVLRSFNYTNEIDTNRMRYSCCNFNMKGWKNDITPKMLDFYVKNPNSSGSITLFENGEICGRASFFEGVNLFKNGSIKSAEYYKFVNEPYLYHGERYKKALDKWMEKNNFIYIDDLWMDNIFIHYKTRVIAQYPPLDGIQVNIKDDILSSGYVRKSTPIKGVNPEDYYSSYSLNIRPICKKLGLKIGYNE